MPVFIDQTGRTISLPAIPRRIVSLVPSQTELLFDLGLDKEIAGITKFCIHPTDWFRTKKRVGGTKQLKMDIIHQLQPDLIIANKEENVKEQVEELEKQFPVWISDVNNLPDAFEMIDQIGLMTNTAKQAAKIINSIKENFSQLPIQEEKLDAIYLIWQNPFMTIGGDTFIHCMMEAAGFRNKYGYQTRYPEISIDDIQSKKPAYLLLSSEPFPFTQKQAVELQKQLPDTNILLVDGEMFSWYGSRLIKAPHYFNQLRNQLK